MAFEKDLELYKVLVPDEYIYYIKDFLSVEEESSVMEEIYKVPKPKWTNLKYRRLQNWGGIPQSEEKPMLVEPLPQYLAKLSHKIESVLKDEDVKFNHVLINEYESGQGITEHEDGPIYLPLVATVNLSSSLLINYRPKSSSKGKNCLQLLLEPRSLVIMGANVYTEYLHSIEPTHKESFLAKEIDNFGLTDLSEKYRDKDALVELDRKLRVSLTFRRVKKFSVLNTRSPLMKFIKK